MDRNKIKDIIKIINIIEIMLVLVKICINLAILNKFLIQMLKIIWVLELKEKYWMILSLCLILSITKILDWNEFFMLLYICL